MDVDGYEFARILAKPTQAAPEICSEGRYAARDRVDLSGNANGRVDEFVLTEELVPGQRTVRRGGMERSTRVSSKRPDCRMRAASEFLSLEVLPFARTLPNEKTTRRHSRIV